MSDYIVSALLVIVGAAVAIHYFLMANALTKAQAWVKLAIPAAASSGAGMAACGLFAAVGEGLIFAMMALTFVTAVQLETWRCGAYVSDVFRRAAEVREKSEARTRQILYGIKEPMHDMRDILTPSGFDLLQEIEAKEKARK